VANAADEVAVAAFLEGAITLGQVPEIVERGLEAHRVEPVRALDRLLEIDAWARAEARGQVVRA
jgi:1-deoxy-D-xylulose-5-phosphate reductoisomerase